MTLYGKSCGPDWSFANVFVRENVAYGYDVQKYTVDAILFREIQCKKMDNLMF